MVRFVPFRSFHLRNLDLHSQQKHLERHLYALSGLDFANPALSYSAKLGKRIVGCAGVLPEWQGRARTWAFFDACVPRRAWPAISAKMIDILDDAHNLGHSRIEATVSADFAAAMNFVEHLGFVREFDRPMREYGPDGGDYWLYVRFPHQCPSAQKEAA